MANQSRKIGIEFISVFGLPPVEFVDVVRKLGCDHIGTALEPLAPNQLGCSAWSLREDASLRRELVAALRANGVSLSLGEGFLVREGGDMRASARDMDLMHELGAPRLNALSIDPDFSRGTDELAVFAEMAGERGMDATLEYLPGYPIGDLDSAVAAVRAVNKPNFRLLIDAMHFFRAGAKASDLAAVDPSLIGYVQLCDVPTVSKFANYADEARYERMGPGEGELPLADFLAALSPELVVGLEIPMLSKAKAGLAPYERLAPSVEATRRLVAQAAR